MNVLFDLDGTLTDPREGILACFKHALEKLQVALPTDPRNRGIHWTASLGKLFNIIRRER